MVNEKMKATLRAEIIRELGRAGGKARAAAMSPKARSVAAKTAVLVRWAKYRAAKAAGKMGKEMK